MPTQITPWQVRGDAHITQILIVWNLHGILFFVWNYIWILSKFIIGRFRIGNFSGWRQIEIPLLLDVEALI